MWCVWLYEIIILQQWSVVFCSITCLSFRTVATLTIRWSISSHFKFTIYFLFIFDASLNSCFFKFRVIVETESNLYVQRIGIIRGARAWIIESNQNTEIKNLTHKKKDKKSYPKLFAKMLQSSNEINEFNLLLNSILFNSLT